MSLNALLLVFIIVYSFVTTLISLLLYRRIRQISRQALTNIDEISSKLKNQMQAADDGKNRILAILQSMTEGVLVVDASQKIIMANAVLVDAFDLKREEVKGKYFWEVFRDPEINEMIEQGLKKQAGFSREHAALLTNSIFQIQGSPVFGESEFLGVVAVFHNVTKLKDLEKARSEFVANVSHELKTPLTSIMGFVETLKEGAIEDPENRLKFFHIIEDHSKKLSSLIEDLLILSKIESGKQEFKKESIDFEKMTKNIVGLFEKIIESKNIKVFIEVDPKPFLFFGDSKSLEQAMTNLIDNAIKYNEPGGSVHIQATYQTDQVKIEVRDTGIGIPEADLPRVFERFYRVDKSRSRESGGTGLGLSIVKHIVEKHSGKVEVENVPPKGARFTAVLPKNP